MKNKLFSFLAAVALCLFPALSAAQDEPLQMNHLAVTDLSVTTAVISWTTNQKTIGNKVEITSPDSTWEVTDSYGFSAYTHLVQLQDLEPTTEYIFKVFSGDAVWDEGGNGYKFSTIGYIPTSATPVRNSGKLENSWSTPLDRCLIRYWLSDGFGGLSLPRVVLSGQDGNWIISNLGNMFNSTGTGSMTYYGDDNEKLILELVPNYWTTVTDTLDIVTDYGTMTIQVTDPSSASPGDVDGNGSLNIFDVLDILKVIGKKVTPDPRMQAASDLDGNGKVDIFDLLELLKRLKTAGK